MKKTLLIATVAAMTVLSAYAKFEGNGYYRVQNYMTDRYLYVLDNRADIDYGATSVDMNGVELWRGEERMISDAATILYIEKIGNEYDIYAQGTSIHQMSDTYLKLLYKADKDAYYAYGSKDGVTKYLGDPSSSTVKDKSYLKDTATGDYRLWRIKPVETEGSNYFGVIPTVTADGRRYAPLYGDFPFSPASAGVKVWYVSRVDVDKKVVVMSELTGTVAAATPVFISCAGTEAADNKLNIGGTATAITGNKLIGNYFDNDGTGGHYNRTPNDPATMRFLGVTSDGHLGYVTSAAEFVPRNISYLKVAAGSPAELRVVTEAEYAEMGGVENVKADVDETFDVYNLQGVKVRSNARSLSGLPAGIYVAGGRKVVVK